MDQTDNSNPPKNTDLEKIRLSFATDSIKLLFETMKQLSTLSAGSMVLSASLQPQLRPPGTFIACLGFIAFLHCTFHSLWTMRRITMLLGDSAGETEHEICEFCERLKTSNGRAFIAFLVGLTLISFAFLIFHSP